MCIRDSFSGIRRKYIAPVLSPFADGLISSGYAGGRPQSRLCACPRAGWKACPTVPVSNLGPELGLQPLCGDTGSGASSPASRGKVSAFRRCRSTTRGHVPEMYPQYVLHGCYGCTSVDVYKRQELQRIQSQSGSIKVSMVYLTMIQEAQNIVTYSINLMKVSRKFQAAE